MKIVIVAFNYAHAGTVVNGPGMCLFIFHKILKQFGYQVKIFTELKSKYSEIASLKNSAKIKKEIIDSDLVIHWSGITPQAEQVIKFAGEKNKRIFLGPNLIDTVFLEKESQYLSNITFDKILTVNEQLIFKISREHQVSLAKIHKFLIGPDLELWEPVDECDNTILWKGNSKQPVKDVEFALKIKKHLPQFQFKFIGYPQPYDYFQHIASAKKSKIFLATSWSETMGLALLESWCAGIPSISHPKIQMLGENYQTGIIVNKNLTDYSEAIKEVMLDRQLYRKLQDGSREYILDNFSNQAIMSSFQKLL